MFKVSTTVHREIGPLNSYRYLNLGILLTGQLAGWVLGAVRSGVRTCLPRTQTDARGRA